MTFKEHKAKWINCTRCELCVSRKRVVLLRGKIPCDILFIGEAPGKGENVTGKPFVGPAGYLLDQLIDRCVTSRTISVAGKLTEYTPTYAITNLVGCMPIDDEGDKVAQPPKESIEACAPRLKEVVNMCKPRLIVCLGNLATEYVHKSLDIKRATGRYKWCDLLHPASIVRLDSSQKSLAFQRTRVKLSNAIDDLFIRR